MDAFCIITIFGTRVREEGEGAPSTYFYHNLNPLAPGGAFWMISINGIV